MKPAFPSSLAFWHLSWGYRDAGDATFCLVRSDSYAASGGGFAYLPCVFLYFRCVELALKAILVHNSVPAHEITQKVGHRISPLLARAESFAALSTFGISAQDRRLLDRYSADYSEKWFEYPDDVSPEYPPLDDLKAIANQVCDAARTYLDKV